MPSNTACRAHLFSCQCTRLVKQDEVKVRRNRELLVVRQLQALPTQPQNGEGLQHHQCSRQERLQTIQDEEDKLEKEESAFEVVAHHPGHLHNKDDEVHHNCHKEEKAQVLHITTDVLSPEKAESIVLSCLVKSECNIQDMMCMVSITTESKMTCTSRLRLLAFPPCTLLQMARNLAKRWHPLE